MVSAGNRRAEVVSAAGRLFAEKGYHGTSMRDLGRELGVLGSSLYSHVDSKQNLLVEVVESGAALFGQSADTAMEVPGSATERLRALISGHVDVVLDNLDVARTFLNEAGMLDEEHRSRVIAARDSYEKCFRQVLERGSEDGEFRADLDVPIASILILSVLNAVERWYRAGGGLDRDQLVEELGRFVISGIT